MTYMWNLKSDTDELAYKKKQTYIHKEQTCGCQGGKWQELADANCQCRMDIQQGPSVLHRELYSVSCNDNRKESEYIHGFVCSVAFNSL